jgi:hypothetical protein
MAEEGASNMPGGWWIPVLAAVVGLVGGIGGAYVGGEVSNNGQEQQFENQRTAELQDLLIDAYASYLRDATTVWVAATGEDPDTRQLAAEALASETEVEFEAASPGVDDAAKQLFDAATKARLLSTFEDARDDFIDAAGRSLDE